jgi:hypothetical protein
MSIPWVYVYSEPFFDKVMQATINGFELIPIKREITTIQEKASLILDSLKNTSAPYIIFSDSDIIVKPSILYEFVKLSDDIVFLEGSNGSLQTGIMRIRNTLEVIEFWQTLTTLEESLQKFPGTYSKFPGGFVTSDTWDRFSEFYVLKVIPTNLGKEFDFAEKIFTMAQHIELQDYMKYVPDEVTPFIYKIQELLFLSYKEMQS